MLLNYGKRQIRNPFFLLWKCWEMIGGERERGEGRRGRRETEKGITRCLQTRMRKKGGCFSLSISLCFFILFYFKLYQDAASQCLEYECFQNKAWQNHISWPITNMTTTFSRMWANTILQKASLKWLFTLKHTEKWTGPRYNIFFWWAIHETNLAQKWNYTNIQQAVIL